MWRGIKLAFQKNPRFGLLTFAWLPIKESQPFSKCCLRQRSILILIIKILRGISKLKKDVEILSASVEIMYYSRRWKMLLTNSIWESRILLSTFDNRTGIWCYLMVYEFAKLLLPKTKHQPVSKKLNLIWFECCTH